MRKKSKDQILELLEKMKFDIDLETNNYNYLIKMPMDSVSKDNVEKLMKEHENKTAELEEIKNMTVEKMWLKELKNLKKTYKEFLEEDEKGKAVATIIEKKPKKK